MDTGKCESLGTFSVTNYHTVKCRTLWIMDGVPRDVQSCIGIYSLVSWDGLFLQMSDVECLDNSKIRIIHCGTS